MKIPILTLLFFSFLNKVFAQTGSVLPIRQSPLIDTLAVVQSKTDQQPSTGKKWMAGGLAATSIGGSLLFLTKANNYEYSKEFKTVNDGEVWLQLDKSEHFFLAYTSARFLAGLGSWAGFSSNQAVLLGSAGSLLYLTTKEFLDSHNVAPGTGWSWLDMGANTLGIGLFASQQLIWQEQKLQVKFSALPKKYEPALNERANILFGNSIPERILKDHNAQTYWLSLNLKALGSNSKLPDWLNLAIGYGGTNLYGQVQNLGFHEGQLVFDRRDLKGIRQWYISPDIDLTKIKTNNRAVKTLLFTLNMVKVPLPALEFSNNTFKGHWLHF